MRLVSAKCPNCGANIEVDKDTNKTKCDYCKSNIIVDDAIAKYKLEVEIKDLPKLDNYLKLGKRYYDNKDYEDAYNVYSKALEIEPDSVDAVFYKGICKTLCTNYKDFDIYSALSSTKNALKLLDDIESQDFYIMRFVYTTLILKDFAIEFYDNHKLNLVQVEKFLERLNLCLDALEYSYKNVNSDKNKIFILNTIIKLINYILKKKMYVTDSYKKGIYIRPYENKLTLVNKRTKYGDDLFKLNPSSKLVKEIKTKNVMGVLWYIFLETYILINACVAFIKNNNLIWGILLLIDFILILPFVSNKIFKNNKIGMFIKVVLLMIGVIGGGM